MVEKDTAIPKDPAKGSDTHHERDLEKGKKLKTKPGNPKPQQDKPEGNPRDGVAHKLQTSTTKSPRRYGNGFGLLTLVFAVD